MSRLRNVVLATGLLAFAGAGLAFPFFLAGIMLSLTMVDDALKISLFKMTSRSKPIIDSSKPLPPQATFRGPYVNTGSRDIGPDPSTYPKT